MRLSILILISLLTYHKDSTVVTGVVEIDNDQIAGCEVKVLEKGTSQLTDTNGQFRLITSNLNKVTLSITYLDGWTCKLIIENIPLDLGDVDLGTIPLVYNEMLDIEDYQKLDSDKKAKYEEVRHWTQLLGYINRTTVDTTALRTALWTKRKIKYSFNPTDNTAVVNYKDWRK